VALPQRTPLRAIPTRCDWLGGLTITGLGDPREPPTNAGERHGVVVALWCRSRIPDHDSGGSVIAHPPASGGTTQLFFVPTLLEARVCTTNEPESFDAHHGLPPRVDSGRARRRLLNPTAGSRYVGSSTGRQKAYSLGIPYLLQMQTGCRRLPTIV
jgi:hypothetical protein